MAEVKNNWWEVIVGALGDRTGVCGGWDREWLGLGSAPESTSSK